MLTYLRVRDLALLDDVELEFAAGMNVLTGETGAGKSILVGALSLLRGARGRAELIRDGADTAIVDAHFESPSNALEGLLAEHGLGGDTSDGLVIRRAIGRTGRSRAFAQSTLTTNAVIGRLGEELIDICSQHEHHFLTQTSKHLEVLDTYAGLDDERASYRTSYEDLRRASAGLAELRKRTDERGLRVDYLSFQLEELERVAPEPGEYEALRRRLALLRNAQRWAEFAEAARCTLYEDDDAIASRLAAMADRAGHGDAESELLEQIREQLVAAQVACEEAAAMASRFSQELEVDPTELQAAEDRFFELDHLRRKHGVDVDDLIERAQQMRAELLELESADDHLAALTARVDELRARCQQLAEGLSRARRGAAEGLAKALRLELSALHIRAARFELQFESTELGPTGRDHVELLFSANRGEPLAPLRRVASGGELSRVLLAIKGVLAAGDRVATYVFDEVDAGVGGAVAEAIGRRLRRAAAQHQVLVVTHLPQIAAFADAHFRVEKQVHGGRTSTKVVLLDERQRVEELARMLGGARISQSAREHASALLSEARA